MCRVIICGGRDYRFDGSDTLWLDAFHKEFRLKEVITGAANGADTGGYNWARKTGIDCVRFDANWEKYKKSAGAIRNKKMLLYLLSRDMRDIYGSQDIGVIAFAGGPGTANMVSLAQKEGVIVYHAFIPLNNKRWTAAHGLLTDEEYTEKFGE